MHKNFKEEGTNDVLCRELERPVKDVDPGEKWVCVMDDFWEGGQGRSGK